MLRPSTKKIPGSFPPCQAIIYQWKGDGVEMIHHSFMIGENISESNLLSQYSPNSNLLSLPNQMRRLWSQ